MHKKTTISSGDTDSHRQPVASPKENAPATPPNHNRTEPLQIVSYPHQTFKQRGLQLTTASMESLLQSIIPLQPARILIRLNRKVNYFVKGKSRLCVSIQTSKIEEKSRGSQGKKAKIDDS